jgi:FKBP-type peptidyl-prolyl cis-trans isomerase
MGRTTAFFIGLFILAGMSGLPVAQAQPAPANALPAFEDQLSYAIGLDIGRSLLADKMPVKPELVARGIADGLKKAQPLLTDEQIRAVMAKFSQSRQTELAGANKANGDKNLKEGQAFLAANKTKPGVQATESGLQYLVVKAGNGPSPKATDKVSVHYHGTFLDGNSFDSTTGNAPARFPVNGVIAGWTEALQKMKVGEKWKLFIPSELAYGPGGTPDGTIPPNATLIFDVELLEILK